MKSRLLRLLTIVATFLGLLVGFGAAASVQATTHSPDVGVFNDGVHY